MVAKKAGTAVAEKASATPALVNVRFDDDALRNISNVQDVMALMTETYGRVDSITDFELGNGFKLVREDEKSRLVGEPFIVLASDFHMGEWNEFASMFIFVPRTNEKLILNDGGAGVPEQVRELQRESGRVGGWHAPRGLRVSEYLTCKGVTNNPCGKPRPKERDCELCGSSSDERGKGATYYLDISA